MCPPKLTGAVQHTSVCPSVYLRATFSQTGECLSDRYTHTRACERLHLWSVQCKQCFTGNYHISLFLCVVRTCNKPNVVSRNKAHSSATASGILDTASVTIIMTYYTTEWWHINNTTWLIMANNSKHSAANTGNTQQTLTSDVSVKIPRDRPDGICLCACMYVCVCAT